MDPLAQSEISRELGPGERLLWTGRPRQGITFHAFDIVVIPFGIFWCSMLLFGFFGSFDGTKPAKGPTPVLPFTFFLIPFFLAGFYMLIGRFLVDMWLRRRITYAVSNQRVIIAYTVFSRTVKSIQARNLGEVSLKERANGGGTITTYQSGLL